MPQEPISLDIGIDIGGTFTDVVGYTSDKRMLALKVLTTSKDPTEAVRTAVDKIIDKWGIKAGDVRRFLHGTTLATNAVLEQQGAKIGLVTTKGFRDVLEIGRGLRHAVYETILSPVTPTFLAPRPRRKEVVERIIADGSVLVPLSEESVIGALEELIAEDVEAIAVCYLFSFFNKEHELRTREIISRIYPHLPVSLSCEVDPAFREYERTVATCFDAYLKPVLDRYLQDLEEFLVSMKFEIPLQIMQARGGITTSEIARRHPIRLFLSGPAAGVIGGRAIGKAAGVENLITVDIGGTSCDIALIQGGQPVNRAEGNIGGFPVRVPMIDINTIGAGGGSIAWLDQAGSLRVGPRSAGADPGPACYGRGGENPTVTDASVVLGYIDPHYFADNVVTLNASKARQSIHDKLAGPLNLSVEDVALGIHRILNVQMTEGIRAVSVRQGIDPRHFTLLPMGGAGPLHATDLADELGIRSVLIPRYPGVLSAMGLLTAQVEHEAACSYLHPLSDIDVGDLAAGLETLDIECRKYMDRQQVPREQTQISYFADMCYIGQSYYIEIPLTIDCANTTEKLYDDFLVKHESVYGHSVDSSVQIVNLRAVHHAGGWTDLAIKPHGKARRASPLKAERYVTLRGSAGPELVDVFDRESLEFLPDEIIIGPAVVEQSDTTILLNRGWRARTIQDGSLLISRI